MSDHQTKDPDSHPADFDPGAIYEPDGPINPGFMLDAVRTLMRALPLDSQTEPTEWGNRRMLTALIALSATRPRDEIEVMLGVQAIAAYHAASTAWYLAANGKLARGDSLRQITTAANAARTFDTLLKALERRQLKPLPPPPQRPDPKAWNLPQPTTVLDTLKTRFIADNDPEPATPDAEPLKISEDDLVNWTKAHDRLRIEAENQGLDIENTEGILPGGGMIMPENPTPQQEAYLGRRLKLLYDQEFHENKRKGINKFPNIRPLRTGDYVP